MRGTEIITVEHDCSCGVGCRLSAVDLTCAKCGKVRAVKVDRDPHPSADRIPQFGGALPWREPFTCLHPDSIKTRNGADGEIVVSVGGDWRWMHRDAVARLTVALLCLLLCGGCSFVAYQHNDYRTNPTPQPHGVGAPAAPTFPGMLGLSPGIEDLARLAGSDCWVAHSAGAARAVSLIRPDRSPRALLLIDPWPPNIEVPDGPELVVVITGRPGRVTVAPGTRLVERTHAGGVCPWAWTVGHVYACRWPESLEAASMAAAAARMASAGSE